MTLANIFSLPKGLTLLGQQVLNNGDPILIISPAIPSSRHYHVERILPNGDRQLIAQVLSVPTVNALLLLYADRSDFRWTVMRPLVQRLLASWRAKEVEQ